MSFIFFVLYGGSTPLNPPVCGEPAPPPSPTCFWIESPNEMDIGYCWLALLNQVRKNLLEVKPLLSNDIYLLSNDIYFTMTGVI